MQNQNSKDAYFNLKFLTEVEAVQFRYCDEMPFAVNECLELLGEHSFNEVIDEILPYNWNFSPNEREIISKVVRAMAEVEF